MKRIGFFIASLFLLVAAQAQQTYIMYGFRSLPQHTLLNPAMQGDYRVSIGLPVISRIEFNVSNTPFGANLLDAGSTISEQLLSSVEAMTDEELLYGRNRIDVLFVGFHIGENGYFSLGSYQETEFAFRYPTPLFKMAILGNAPYLNQTIDMSYTNFQAQSFMAYHAGYSHHFRDLGVGVRLKVLNGIASAHTDVSSLNIRFEEGDLAPFTTTLNSEFELYTSGLDSATFSDYNNYITTYKDHKNLGVALDLGLEYRLGKHFSFSGSALDIGSINWKTNLKSYHSNQVSFQTEGPLYTVGVDDDLGDVFSEFADSLVGIFDIEEKSGQEYSTSLFPKINLGATYHFNDNHELMLTGTHSEVFDVKVQSIGLNYYGRLSDAFSIRLGYGIYNGEYNNFSAGFSMGKTFQFYVMADFLQYAVDVVSMNKANVAFGFNMNFGSKEKKLRSNENGKEPKKKNEEKELKNKTEHSPTTQMEGTATQTAVGAATEAPAAGAAVGATTNPGTTAAVVGAATVVAANQDGETVTEGAPTTEEATVAEHVNVAEEEFMPNAESLNVRARMMAILPAILAKLKV